MRDHPKLAVVSKGLPLNTYKLIFYSWKHKIMTQNLPKHFSLHALSVIKEWKGHCVNFSEYKIYNFYFRFFCRDAKKKKEVLYLLYFMDYNYLMCTNALNADFK